MSAIMARLTRTVVLRGLYTAYVARADRREAAAYHRDLVCQNIECEYRYHTGTLLYFGGPLSLAVYEVTEHIRVTAQARGPLGKRRRAARERAVQNLNTQLAVADLPDAAHDAIARVLARGWAEAECLRLAR